MVSELLEQNLTRAVGDDLEQHAHSVNDAISDGDLRNAHILDAV